MYVDLNSPFEFHHASFRFFKENEHHVKRFCEDDVILLVFSGVLRFTEDGIPYEVSAGQYHIQKHATEQDGPLPSDAPKYLYIHCHLNSTNGNGLPYRGVFDYENCFPLMKKLDMLVHSDATKLECETVFLQILTELYHTTKAIETANAPSPAEKIEHYLSVHYAEKITLQQLADYFGYCKNRIISVFRTKYNMTPINYLNQIRLQKAKHLLEVTSDTVQAIAYSVGFGDYTQFYKMFERENGISPTEWRNRIRKI